MRRRKLCTKYNEIEVDVGSLHGSAVLYSRDACEILAGTKMRDGKVLKKSVTLPPGTIFMPRLFKPEQGRAYFVWQIFPYGIFDALRGVMHIQSGYDTSYEQRYGRIGEVALLEDVRAALNTILGWLATYGSLSDLEKDALGEFLDGKVESVGAVTDQNKQRALMRMIAASKKRDSAGRVNPSARMARAVGARGDLQERLNLIRFIDPRIGTRAVALATEDARIRRLYVQVYQRFDRVGERSIGSAIAGMGDSAKRFGVTVIGMLDDLLSIRVGPYPSHVERLDKDARRLAEFVGQNHKKKALAVRARILESLRCKKARWDLESIRTPLSVTAHGNKSDQQAAVAAGVHIVLAGQLQTFSGKMAGISDEDFSKRVRSYVVTRCDRAAELLLDLNDFKGAKTLVGEACNRL